MPKLSAILNSLLSLFIPEDHNLEWLLKIDARSLRRILPRAERATDRHTYTLFDYRNKKVRAFVWGIKYKNHPLLLERAGFLMHEEIMEMTQDRMIFENKKRIGLIPIPMHDADERKRGWNQSLELCRAIEEQNKLNGRGEMFIAPLLQKVKQTEHQRNLSRENRLENIKKSFEAKGEIPTDSLLLMIDDVTTTGATLTEARHALANIGHSETLAVTLAH